MLRLSELQNKIDEAAEEMRHIAHDTEHQEYWQHQTDLQHEGPNHEDKWYEAFNHDNIKSFKHSGIIKSSSVQETLSPSCSIHYYIPPRLGFILARLVWGRARGRADMCGGSARGGTGEASQFSETQMWFKY